jgi:hypothetical protein
VAATTLQFMADEPENIILRHLRRIEGKIDAMSLRLDDVTNAVHRLEGEVGALRGMTAALRHDVTVYGNRWTDLEGRVRAVEDDETSH